MSQSNMGEDVKLLLTTLARGENAMSLVEFVQATNMSVEKVTEGLDLLVALKILDVDNSFYRSEMGEMVYSFANSDNAQAIYDSIVDEN